MILCDDTEKSFSELLLGQNEWTSILSKMASRTFETLFGESGEQRVRLRRGLEFLPCPALSTR